LAPKATALGEIMWNHAT